MTPRPGSVRRRVEEGLLVLGVAAVAWAVVQPRLAAGARADELARVREVVDTLRGAVEAAARDGAEPAAGAPDGGGTSDGLLPEDTAPEGTVPEALAPYLPDDLTLASATWRLSVRTWAVPGRGVAADVAAADIADIGGVDPVSPDTLGGPTPAIRHRRGVTLATADATLLADLLDAYGREASFVNGATWTFVFPEPPRP